MKTRYSDIIMEHFMEPRHQGRLAHPSGTGVAGTPGRGPYLVIQIRCVQGQVTEARFQSHNCGVTIACGSMLTELISNRPIAECKSIAAECLAEALGGVPVDKQHVLQFAIDAVRMALTEAEL